MVVLQIEHQVPSYEIWRKAFEADPIGRKRSGVKGIRIYRSAEDANHIIVDVSFETMEAAKAVLGELQKLWGKVQGVVVSVPRTRFMETVEEIEI